MNAVKKLIIYFKLSGKVLREKPGLSSLHKLLRYLPRWWKYTGPHRSPLSDQIPWLPFDAITYIEAYLKPDMTVFEFGSGGSTLFWASRVKQVISVEHETSWYHKMKEQIQKLQIRNVRYLLAEAEVDADPKQKTPDNPDHYLSGDTSFSGKTFRTYVTQIDQFPEKFFDVIVIDGRARPSCLKHALDKVKMYGIIIVDNTERNYYLRQFSFSPRAWKRIDFKGPVPYSLSFSQTSIFQKLR